MSEDHEFDPTRVRRAARVRRRTHDERLHRSGSGAGEVARGAPGEPARPHCQRRHRSRSGGRPRRPRRPGCRRYVERRAVHRDAQHDLTGRRMASGRRAAGREGPRRQVQRPADGDERPGPEVDYRPEELRHRGSLQLPVPADLADRELPAGRPAQDQGLEGLLPHLHQGQGAADEQGLHPGPGRCARTGCSTSTRTAPPGCRRRRRPGRRTSRSSSGGTRPRTSRSGASRSLGGSWARRPTSTWTRWATTAASSTSGRGRCPGPSC